MTAAVATFFPIVSPDPFAKAESALNAPWNMQHGRMCPVFTTNTDSIMPMENA